MTGLFPRPMAELKDLFVGYQLLERFQRADIESAVGRCQIDGNGPESIDWWVVRDEKRLTKQPQALLERCATPAGGRLNPIIDPNISGLYWSQRDGQGVYAPNSALGTLMCSSDGGRSFLATEYDSFSSVDRARMARFIVSILVDEWARKMPKWEEARTFLYEMAKTRLKRARTEAEADFDKAVAVSSDGKRACRADWVVVVSAEKNYLLHSASFQNNKAKLSGIAAGNHQFPHVDHKTADSIWQYFRTGSEMDQEFRSSGDNYRVALASCGESTIVNGTEIRNFVSVLMVLEEFCPALSFEEFVEI